MIEYICEFSDHPNINDKGALREKVVRCRDCEFYYPKEGAMLSCKFEYHNFTQWRLAKPDGFCAWGVKRKKGGDGLDAS